MPSTACRTLSLPVTPLVHRIVLATTNGAPLFISREQRKPFNPYAAHLFALLQRERRYVDAGPAAQQDALTQILPVLVPEWQVRYGCLEEVTTARAVAFSTFVTSSFRQQLRVEIDLRIQFSKNLKQAVELSLARWGVDEDVYALSTAIRHYHRHRDEAAGSVISRRGSALTRSVVAASVAESRCLSQ